MLKWLWLSAVVIVFDQLSKYLASIRLELYQPIEVMPLFNLTLMHNTGAAFSFLSSAGGWQRWFFSVIALVVSVVIVAWLKRLRQQERLQALALALILGGALGNVIDRLLRGHVVDFLDFYYIADRCLPLFVPIRNGEAMACHWPAFNLADSAISVGVALLIIESVRSAFQQKRIVSGNDNYS